MSAVQEFLSMGGYGAYIWSSYLVTFVVLGLNLYMARKEYQTRLRNVLRLQNRSRSNQREAQKTQQRSEE